MDRAVFINYRGEDSHSYGALLFTELARQFGEDHVFLDAECIPAGADFVEEMLARVRSARVLLAVIGPRWLTATDPTGRRRIDDPADWIHQELAEAFSAGVRVIPVLTDMAELPGTTQLPADLAALSRCQYRRLRYREPTADLARIVTDLASMDPLLTLAARHHSATATVPSGRALLNEQVPPAAMFSMRGDIPNFVGRQDALATLLDTVSTPAQSVTVHTVDGMPGVGKTIFSVHAAHHLADRFPDGQIFLELHGHSLTQAPRDPADALASLLVATGMDRSILPTDVDDRARLWRDRIAGKKVLLVLDDAASHDQVRPLLPGTPGCFLLITSRHRLPGLDSGHTLALAVLPPDQAAHLLLTCAHRDPATSNPDTVARVVALCGHLPLAIALAAGRLRCHPTWTINYLADLLAQDPTDRLEHLAAGDRSVRAAFTVSYEHLTPERQWIFTLLGVHPGPSIDAYALAALADCSLTQARQHLEALHADHLIQETAPGRYQLHDLLRAYAGSLAAIANQVDSEQAMRGVLEYYLHATATADGHMPGYATPTLTITPHTPAHHRTLDTPQRARAWLDTELATLASCVEQAQNQADLVVQLAVTLHNYLRSRGAWDYAYRIHHSALAAAERGRDRLGQATTFTNLGRLHYLRGDFEQAQRVFDRSHQLFTDLDDRRGQAIALGQLSILYYLRGEFERAQHGFEQSRWLFTGLDHRRWHANTHLYLGVVAHLRGDYERAQQQLDQADQLFTDLDHQHGHEPAHALTLLHQGIVHHRKREYDRALDLLRQTYAQFIDIGDPDGQAHTLNSLGDLALDHPPAGDPHALFTEAHTLAHTIGSTLREADALVGLGRCAQQAHDVLAATTAFAQALIIYQRIGSPNAAIVRGYLADLNQDTDQSEMA